MWFSLDLINKWHIFTWKGAFVLLLKKEVQFPNPCHPVSLIFPSDRHLIVPPCLRHRARGSKYKQTLFCSF